MTAVLTLLRRYRGGLLRMLFAAAFAAVTAWVYADIAQFVDARHPQLLGWALLLKTGIVYVALFVILWEFKRMVSGDVAVDSKATTRPAAPPAQPEPTGKLDELIDKPKLRQRRSAILDKE